MTSLPSTQKAIRFQLKPKEIRVEEIDVPKIDTPDDAIVKVELAGLCGSDLHVYRGSEEISSGEPFVMGHELYGEIVALGESFNADSELKIGMKVISAFSTSCLKCEFCLLGFTSRCIHSQLLGSPGLPGAQAQYIRIPNAAGTLIPADSNLDPQSSLLLADILPTGYFAVLQAFTHPNLAGILNPDSPERGGLMSNELKAQLLSIETQGPIILNVAVIGLGPVGFCCLVALVDFALDFDNRIQKRIGFRIHAFDLLEARRNDAARRIAKVKDKRIAIVEPYQPVGEPRIQISFLAPDQAVSSSCQAVMEVVGSPKTLELAAKLARPFGVISSVGVHTSPSFGIHPTTLYDKNLSLSFGRCPARALLQSARALLANRQELFEGFIDRVVLLNDEHAVKDAYEKFERGESGKLCFAP